MSKLQILPPDVVTDKRRYFADLEYRFEVDQEVAAERYERLKLLFTDCESFSLALVIWRGLMNHRYTDDCQRYSDHCTSRLHCLAHS